METGLAGSTGEAHYLLRNTLPSHATSTYHAELFSPSSGESKWYGDYRTGHKPFPTVIYSRCRSSEGNYSVVRSLWLA